MADEAPILWHIKISNFNEKARWALDAKRVPHHRRAPMPGAHMAIALIRTRRSATFPILQLDGETIADSTRIIEALEGRHPDPPLYPADPDERRRALALEEFFDENLGHDVRRVTFQELFAAPSGMRAHASEMTTPRQGRVLAAALPVFTALTRRRYRIDEAAAEQSLLKIRAALALIERELNGRDYLVGDAFSVADLTAAALLGPLLRPPQFPYRTPDGAMPGKLDEIASELRASPAGTWALGIYERHRPLSAEIGADAGVSVSA